MAGGKETPRQKMIGMMYLVLTALLAMNVSKDILNAFVVVNEGLYKSNEIFKNKNEQLFADFEAAKAKDAAKVEPFLKLANDVKKNTDELNKYIEALKKQLIIHTDGVPAEAADTLVENMIGISSKDNYDKPTELMIGSEPASPKAATEEWSALQLKKKIEDYREATIKLFDAKDPSGKDMFLPAVKEGMKKKVAVALDLPGGIENGVPAPWEIINFYHLPLVAAITNLSKIQTDINNVEADVVGTLLAAVKGKDVTFDKLTAKVIAPSSYILQGDEYKADVLLVAFNSTSNPKIYIGDVDTTIKDEFKNPIKGTPEELKDVSAGAGHYVIKTGSEGLQRWSGVIEVDAPEGKKYYPFGGEYMVAKPAAAVSPDKMNVFYIGVDNPVSITAAGVAPENLSPSMSGGTLSGSRGKYNVRVSGGTEATINVGAKFGGKTTSMGSFKFRVKRIPDPIGNFGGKEGDDLIPKNLLTSVQGVTAVLKNFDFDVKFVVQSFDVTMTSKGVLATESSNSMALTGAQKSLLNGAKSGTRVYIENIRAKGPDGTVRKIPGVNLKVQ